MAMSLCVYKMGMSGLLEEGLCDTDCWDSIL